MPGWYTAAVELAILTSAVETLRANRGPLGDRGRTMWTQPPSEGVTLADLTDEYPGAYHWDAPKITTECTTSAAYSAATPIRTPLRRGVDSFGNASTHRALFPVDALKGAPAATGAPRTTRVYGTARGTNSEVHRCIFINVGGCTITFTFEARSATVE